LGQRLQYPKSAQKSGERTRQGAARLERAADQVNGHAALRHNAQKSPDFCRNPRSIMPSGRS